MLVFLFLLLAISTFAQSDQVKDDFKKLVFDMKNEMKDDQTDFNAIVHKLQTALDSKTLETEQAAESELADLKADVQAKEEEAEVSLAGWKNWTPPEKESVAAEAAEAVVVDKKSAEAQKESLIFTDASSLADVAPESRGWFSSLFMFAIVFAGIGAGLKYFMRKNYTPVKHKRGEFTYSKIDETRNLIQRGSYQSGSYYQNNDFTAA